MHAKEDLVLAQVQKENPELYAKLRKGRINVNIDRFLQQVEERGLENMPRRQVSKFNAWRRHADVLQDFMRGHLYDFRPNDLPFDERSLTDTSDVLLSHALFRNGKTDEYLATSRDRSGYEGPSVDCKIINGAGRTQQDISREAHWFWTDNLLRLMRWYPFTQRDKVEALEDAERLRDKFSRAAAKQDDGKPSRPLARIFNLPEAFQRAYAGAGGLKQALKDIYGPEGNAVFLHKAAHTSDPALLQLESAYHVPAQRFLYLYERLDEIERGNFRMILDKFSESAATQATLGILEWELCEKISQNTSKELGWLKRQIALKPR